MIGFGTFREGLEALTYSLSAGDEKTVERLAEMGRLLEGGPAGPLEHFELADELLVDAEGMEDDVLFVGPLPWRPDEGASRRGRCGGPLHLP